MYIVQVTKEDSDDWYYQKRNKIAYSYNWQVAEYHCNVLAFDLSYTEPRNNGVSLNDKHKYVFFLLTDIDQIRACYLIKTFFYTYIIILFISDEYLL